MAEKTTHKRVRTDVIDGLAGVLETAGNGMPMEKLLDAILTQALDQLREQKQPPGPLPIVAKLRSQCGLGAADALRTLHENREELRSVVREEVQAGLKDLGKKYEAMLADARAEKKRGQG